MLDRSRNPTNAQKKAYILHCSDNRNAKNSEMSKSKLSEYTRIYVDRYIKRVV